MPKDRSKIRPRSARPLKRAMAQVKAGKPALVDAIVWRRGENA